MAEIGNEVKLVLKLAKERMKVKRLELSRQPNTDNWLAGYEYADIERIGILDEIVHELEIATG